MDIDAQDEQLTDLLMDLPPAERNGSRQGDLLGQALGGGDGGAQEVLEQGGLDALGQGVRDGQLGHVVLLLPQRDEVVVDARLVLARVVEVEVLRLDVRGRELLGLEARDFGQEGGFLLGRHAPDHHGAVLEEEDFGGVHVGVEVEGGEGVVGVVVGLGGKGGVFFKGTVMVVIVVTGEVDRGGVC